MTTRQRLTLLAAILGSALVSVDSSIVNVALPAIERDLGGGLPAQQWVSNVYLLALGSLILIGGSLGDIYGERRGIPNGSGAIRPRLPHLCPLTGDGTREGCRGLAG